MRKIYKKTQLRDLSSYSKEIIKNITEIISILNENYRENRNIDSDLGGCILLIENFLDIKLLRNNNLKNIVSEYTDEIICSGGVKYTSSLFLLSSDYLVVVIAEEKLSKILLEEYEGEV